MASFQPYPIPYPPIRQQQHEVQEQRQDDQTTVPSRRARDEGVGAGVSTTSTPTSTEEEEDAEPDLHGKSQLATQTQTPPPKRTKHFITPFRAPRPAATHPTPTSTPRTKPTPTPTSFQAPLSKPPLPSPSPFKTPSRPAQRPFKPPTISSSSSSAWKSTPSAAVRITNLERRVQLLRQAVKYQKADLLGEKDGATELKALCEKWKEAGKAAAEMLWDLSGVTGVSTNNSGSSSQIWGGEGGGGANGGFESSWGFSSSPTQSNNPSSRSRKSDFEESWGFNSNSNPTSSPFTSPFTNSTSSSASWGWSNSFSSPSPHIDTESTTDFLSRIDQIAIERGMSRKEVLDEIEGDTKVLETAEEILEKSTQGLKEKLAKRREKEREKKGENGNDEEDEDEEEEFEMMLIGQESKEENDIDDSESDEETRIIALMEKSRGGGRELDDEGASEGGVDETEKGDKEADPWHIGKMMRVVGVDPSLFGWDEDLQDFV